MTNDLSKELINQAVGVLQNDGVIVYPTDTVYGLGCDSFSKKGVEKIYRIKKKDSQKPLSVICSDLSHISEYAIVPNYAYKLMKKVLPGPFTFILKASSQAPRYVQSKNKTIGIRIPDNEICLEIVKGLGHPIVTTSLNISGEETLATPQDLPKEIAHQIDLIIDKGELYNAPSTVIDATGDEPVIIRKGSGKVDFILSHF